jgi:hypothetical protein
MANSAISGFDIEETTAPDGSYFGFDYWDGAQWITVKILKENLLTALSQNFLNTNLTSTGNRSHDFDENDMLWGKVKTFRAEGTIAPTASYASFNFKGYGTTSADVAFRVASQAGTIHEHYSDLSQKMFGDLHIVNGKKVYFDGGNGYIQKSSGSNGIEIIANSGSFVAGWNGIQVRHAGDCDTNSIDTYNTNANSYFAQNNGSIQWQFGKTGNNGAIRGNIGVGYTNTAIITMAQSDGAVKFDVGLIDLSPIPTSPVGLATGIAWNNAGVLEIV